MSGGVIDLKIPGDPAGIYALADWLDTKVSVPASQLRDRVKKTSAESEEFWAGRTGTGFRETSDAIAGVSEPVAVYASDAAATFRAYARRLERGKEEFAGYREEALKTALLVSGTTIALPMPPKTYISTPGQPAPIEHGPNGESIVPLTGERYQEALALHERISGDVGRWWGRLENWIEEHLVGLMARATDFDPLAAAFDTLKSGNEAVRGFPLALSSAVWAENLSRYEKLASTAQTESDLYKKRLRSQNPEINAIVKNLTQEDFSSEARVLSEKVKQLERGSRIIFRSGVVIEIVALSIDVANGGSISSGIVSMLGGLGGGSAGSYVAVGLLNIENPLGVAILVTAASLAVGSWAKSEWDARVPLDIREAIDAGDFGYVFK